MELELIDLRMNRLELANENLRKAYALEQKHSGLLNVVGAMAFPVGKIEEAKDFWGRSIKSNPLNFEPRMNMGSYHVRKCEISKAMEIYKEIFKASPDFMSAQKALGRLQRQGQ